MLVHLALVVGGAHAQLRQWGRGRPSRERGQAQNQQRSARAQARGSTAADGTCANLLASRTEIMPLVLNPYAENAPMAFPDTVPAVDRAAKQQASSSTSGAAVKPAAGFIRGLVARANATMHQQQAVPLPPQRRNRAIMRQVSTERRRQLCTDLYSGTEKRELGQRALQALAVGTKLYPYGVDMSALHSGLRESAPELPIRELNADVRIEALRMLYLGRTDWEAAGAMEGAGECSAGMAFTGEFNRRFFDEDTPARFPTKSQLASALGDDRRAKELYASLSRDGFVQVDTFSGGINLVDDIAEVAAAALDEQASAHPDQHTWLASPRELEAPLRRLFSDASLLRAAHAYLSPHLDTAPSVDSDFYWAASRIGATLNGEQQLVDNFYHHDGNGRQLKLYLFLHDVPAVKGRATRVVRGSHNTDYFSSACTLDTRFSDEWISRKHGQRVERMSGWRGGGFILDTNALHRIAWEDASAARDAVVVQMIAPGKCKRIKQPHAGAHEEENAPCPERIFRPFFSNHAR